MKKILFLLPLITLTGCAGLKPYGSEHSVRLDLSGEATATLDRQKDGLLVTFDVKDNELIVHPDEKIWMSDSVEFYADLRPYRERTLLNSYGRGVFQIIVAPPVGGNPVRSEVLSRGFRVPDGFSTQGRLTEDGYQVQLFLPEKSLTEIHGPIRDILYVDIALKDIDTGASDRSLFWKGNGDNWQYPHNFAPVILP